jgi:hypothetical protein
MDLQHASIIFNENKDTFTVRGNCDGVDKEKLNSFFVPFMTNLIVGGGENPESEVSQPNMPYTLKIMSQQTCSSTVT